MVPLVRLVRSLKNFFEVFQGHVELLLLRVVRFVLTHSEGGRHLRGLGLVFVTLAGQVLAHQRAFSRVS